MRGREMRNTRDMVMAGAGGLGAERGVGGWRYRWGLSLHNIDYMKSAPPEGLEVKDNSLDLHHPHPSVNASQLVESLDFQAEEHSKDR